MLSFSAYSTRALSRCKALLGDAVAEPSITLESLCSAIAGELEKRSAARVASRSGSGVIICPSCKKRELVVKRKDGISYAACAVRNEGKYEVGCGYSEMVK